MTEPDPEINETVTTDPAKPAPGSIRIGPFVISAKGSVMLIYLIIIGFNLLLMVGVVLAALHRAGRL
jgi:hypothetical protein